MSSLAVSLSFKPNGPIASTHFESIDDDSTLVFSRASALFSQMCHAGSPANRLESAASTHFPLTTEGVGGDGWSARTILPAIGFIGSDRSWEANYVNSALASSVKPQASRSDELKHVESDSCARVGGGGVEATAARDGPRALQSRPASEGGRYETERTRR